jgi:16S rRNA (cytosine1402-N4)-methyltransferase
VKIGEYYYMTGYHEPVLIKEVLDYLAVKEGSWYLDCTLGDGGHTLEILGLGGNVIGIDQDPEALKRASQRIKEAGFEEKRFKLLRGNFSQVDILVEDQRFDGVLMDLGVSSLQLDEVERGFSFSKEALLDMRMDPDLGVRALDLVNGLNKGELLKLFEKYGEASDRRVVEAIIRARVEGQITKTTQLAEIISQVFRRSGGKERIHPATVYFQALRIAVNDEINSLTDGLPKVLERLNKNGNLCVISFHSLEDRVVKREFKKWQSLGFGQVITEKPLTPSDEEVGSNPRARSSKLRVFKKL